VNFKRSYLISVSYKRSYLIALMALISLTGAWSSVGAQSIFLQPNVKYITTGVGTEFDLELRVDASITSIKSFVYHLDFDPSKLDTVLVTQGPLLPSSGASTAFGKYIVHDTVLQLEDLILGAGVAVSGPGLLATVRFRVLDTGTVVLTVVYHRVRDVNGTLLSTQAYGSTIYVNVLPQQFNLLSPIGGQSRNGLPGDQIGLSWQASSSVYPGENVTYTLQYGTSATFATGATTTVTGLTGNSYNIAVSGLMAGYEGPYYWRVTARGTVNGFERTCTPASESFVFSYTLVPPEPFNLLGPIGGQSVTGLPGDDVVFSWQATTSRIPLEQVRYRLEYSTSNTFPVSGTEIVQGLTTNSYSVDVGNLEWGYEGNYYWRVTAIGSVKGLERVGAPAIDNFAFAYEHIPPEPFNLLSPANGSIHSLGSIAFFDWQDATSLIPADNIVYVFVISSDPNVLTDILLVSPVSISERYIILLGGPPPGLPRQQPLYWRVTAQNKYGITRPSSSIFSFTISGCCESRVGNANGLGTYPNEVTISDIQLLVAAKFISSLPCEQSLACLAECDVNQSGGANPKCSDITISDISTLVNHLFIAGPVAAPLKSCL